MLETTEHELDHTPLRSALVEGGEEMQNRFEKRRHNLKARNSGAIMMSFTAKIKGCYCASRPRNDLYRIKKTRMSLPAKPVCERFGFYLTDWSNRLTLAGVPALRQGGNSWHDGHVMYTTNYRRDTKRCCRHGIRRKQALNCAATRYCFCSVVLISVLSCIAGK